MIAAPKICHEGPTAVREAAEAHDAAVRRFHDAHAAAAEAERALRAAKAKREAAVREAAERGAALPATTAIVKAEQALADARERVRETEAIALGKARNLVRAIAGHADEWRGDLEGMRRAAIERHAEVATEYVAAVEHVAQVLAVGAWVDRVEQAAQTKVSPLLPPCPPTESVLTTRNPIGGVEVLTAWLAAGSVEPVRPPGGRAEAPAA